MSSLSQRLNQMYLHQHKGCTLYFLLRVLFQKEREDIIAVVVWPVLKSSPIHILHDQYRVHADGLVTPQPAPSSLCPVRHIPLAYCYNDAWHTQRHNLLYYFSVPQLQLVAGFSLRVARLYAYLCLDLRNTKRENWKTLSKNSILSRSINNFKMENEQCQIIFIVAL